MLVLYWIKQYLLSVYLHIFIACCLSGNIRRNTRRLDVRHLFTNELVPRLFAQCKACCDTEKIVVFRKYIYL